MPTPVNRIWSRMDSIIKVNASSEIRLTDQNLRIGLQKNAQIQGSEVEVYPFSIKPTRGTRPYFNIAQSSSFRHHFRSFLSSRVSFIHRSKSIGKIKFHRNSDGDRAPEGIKAAMPTYEIRGIDVDFPFDAYDCQLVYMEKVIQSLQEVSCGNYCFRCVPHSLFLLGACLHSFVWLHIVHSNRHWLCYLELCRIVILSLRCVVSGHCRWSYITYEIGSVDVVISIRLEKFSVSLRIWFSKFVDGHVLERENILVWQIILAKEGVLRPTIF